VPVFASPPGAGTRARLRALMLQWKRGGGGRSDFVVAGDGRRR